MAATLTEGYNQRLFSGDALRRFYHFSRFRWLQAKLAARPEDARRIIELGCFDAKTLDFLPAVPEQYVGLDANWEGGLDQARVLHGSRPEVSLLEVSEPRSLDIYPDGQFTSAIALETLEHIPIAILRDYLAQLARVTRGTLYASVPNEMGPIFLAKYALKHLAYGGSETYTPREVVAATLRQSHKVARDDHKGFDYRELIKDIGEHFEVTRVEGIPFAAIPPAVSLTVGITAVSRR